MEHSHGAQGDIINLIPLRANEMVYGGILSNLWFD